MRRLLSVVAALLLGVMLTGCGAGEDSGDMGLFSKKRIVGKDIMSDDITDFYYTEENINYHAYYQRYRFYVEDEKHFFFHETRERKNEYGPCTEEDTTQTGTIELSDEQWSQFYSLVTGGVVKEREESNEEGDTGPWLYLYWTADKSKYQQFSFPTYAQGQSFVDYCISLTEENAGAGDMDIGQTGEAVLSFESFDGGGPEFHVIIDDENIVTCRQNIRYNSPDHDVMTGAGKNVVIVFTGVNAGETKVLIEERSPIADNLDRRYKVVVDDERNVHIEEISVKDISEMPEDMRLYIQGEEVPVTWEENASIEELKSMLPVTVQMSMYGGFEQVGSLAGSITRDE